MVQVEVLFHTFDASWDQIALASWLKYPNPLRPDVLGKTDLFLLFCFLFFFSAVGVIHDSN